MQFFTIFSYKILPKASRYTAEYIVWAILHSIHVILPSLNLRNVFINLKATEGCDILASLLTKPPPFDELCDIIKTLDVDSSLDLKDA